MNNKKILIVRTDRIGDLILTIPLAGIIKKQFPDSFVSFLVRDYTKDLLIDHPDIDEVITLSEENSKTLFKKNLDLLKQKKFDIAIVVSPTFKLSLILKFAEINRIIGTGYRWYSFLFSDKVFEHRKFGEKHELEYNLGLLKKIGVEKTSSSVEFNIHSEAKSRTKVIDILKQKDIGVSKKIIIFHPGSGGSSIDLPIESYTKLSELVAHNLEVDVIVTGSKEEFEICEKVAGKNGHNLAGLFNLKELTALIEQCSIFIANSTGPIHIAAALGKKVIGFYPKIPSCSAVRWGPYTDNKIIFSPEIGCSNCTREQCERLNCMSNIKIENIFAGIKSLL